MSRRLVAPVVAVVLSIFAVSANAAIITTTFTKLTSNNAEDLSTQLGLSILDSTMANAQFGLTLGVSQVLMVVTNNVGIASNIAEVYVDDNSVPQSLNVPVSVYNSLGGFTEFEVGSPNPGNLPGAPAGFEAIAALSSDVNPGPPGKGINTALDILGVQFTLGAGVDFALLAAAVTDGEIRFGLHVRSIGAAGGSDSYITGGMSQVSEPGSLLLLGLSLLALAGLRRRVV